MLTDADTLAVIADDSQYTGAVIARLREDGVDIRNADRILRAWKDGSAKVDGVLYVDDVQYIGGFAVSRAAFSDRRGNFGGWPEKVYTLPGCIERGPSGLLVARCFAYTEAARKHWMAQTGRQVVFPRSWSPYGLQAWASERPCLDALLLDHRLHLLHDDGAVQVSWNDLRFLSEEWRRINERFSRR